MPIDRGVLDQQLRALGEDPAWWQHRELRDLPAILHGNERVLAVARGKVGRPRIMRRPWLIVATDMRLICLRSARNGRWSQMEVDASLISRVALRIGPFRGRVVVLAAGRTYRLLTLRPPAYRLFTALSDLVPVTTQDSAGFRPTLVVRRVIDHVLALPAAALRPESPASKKPEPPRDAAAEDHVHVLEAQVDELKNQVEFLEQLLHKQQLEAGSTGKLPGDG